MKGFEHFFKGKKVTLMGLGLLGRGVGDAEFLARMGAEVLVTDLKTEKELASSVRRLKKFKNIKFHLGGHRLEDFRPNPRGGRGPDFVLKAAGVPLDSLFIAEARKKGVLVEMDASLFFKLMPRGVTFIGVTGTRGKTTTAYLIYETLREAVRLGLSGLKGPTLRHNQCVFLAGNIKDMATLPLLEKVQVGDFVAAELDSWQLQGFGDSKISPPIAVFTTFLPDHMNYYGGDMGKYFQDKANIFKFQKQGNVLITGEQTAARVLRARPPVAPIVASLSDLPKNWKLKILGEHNRYNAACALRVLDCLGVPRAITKKVFGYFKGVPGRLQHLRTVRGVKIYNDNNATTPDATIAALRALSCHSRESENPEKDSPKALAALGQNQHKIVLILGGTDKVLGKHGALITEIIKRCKAVVMLKETGTETLLAVSHQLLGKDFRKLSAKSYQLKATNIYEVETLKDCVQKAMELARKGDIVLFSPAFASFGKWFKNEYDRGEQFVKIIDDLK